MRFLRILTIACGAAALAVAITPGTPVSPAKAAKTKAKSTAPKKAVTKKYLSSSGKASSGKASPSAASASKANASKAAPKKPAATQTKAADPKSGVQAKAAAPAQRTVKPAPKAPPPSNKSRVLAHEAVYKNVANAAEIPVENPAALIPFFEQLYRHQQGQMPGPVRILHYGDSHTAADEWTGEMRTRLQEKFGDGGSGYSFAGRPYNGYRREDVRSGSTSGWHTDGLVGRAGDGVYGLGGISMSVRTPKEGIYVEADASDFELFYYQQPGGGSLQLYDNGVAVERISTDGEPSPAYYHLEAMPGPHKLELETLDHAPVRLFGWVAEKPTGVTYETLGINGASAPIVLDWNEETLRSNIERRNPALIVLAYGTNEAGQKSWTLESYRDMFEKLIARFRDAAPTATILIIGPPDRDQKTAKRGWQPMDQLDMIVEAQREAAVSSGCPIWDLRAKMGGKGSMLDWVAAGMAQNDHVHFTGAGYTMLGDAVVRDLMSQYELFLKARGPQVVAAQVTPASEP